MMLQKLVLPLLPELHAGNGLLHNDALAFHNHAVRIAELISSNGWSEWRLFPAGGTGNVGVLSALYVIFGQDPACFIPFNAAAHATGALMIYLIGPLLWPGRVGALGGLATAVLFLMFPSALQWYGQNHKDAFAIAGILTMLFAWLYIHSRDLVGKSLVKVLLTALFGALLLAVVRPYFPIVVLGAFASSWFVLVIMSLVTGQLCRDRLVLVKALLLIGVVGCVVALSARSVVASGVYEGAGASLSVNVGSRVWQWTATDFLPEIVDKGMRRASELRVHYVAFGKAVGAGSGIDEDRVPADALAAIAYLPRALFVGLFAPFPSSWMERVSAPRLMSAVETSIWYLLIAGMVVLVYRRPSRALLAGIAFGVFILAVLSYIHPNVGTLYRQRFGVWMFFMLCGAVGWASLILPFLLRASTRIRADSVRDSHDASSYGTARNAGSVAASGVVVLMITFLCYLGFMARDLLLVTTFGMNVRLDAFFSAAMIPMFFVTFLSMPLADAMTASLFNFSGKQMEGVVRTVLQFASLVLGAASLLLVCFAEFAVGLVLREAGLEEIADAARMLRWFAPIILFSGWTVIGNAALNALHRSREAALAQLVVPLFTVVAIIAAPHEFGPYAAIGGMLGGTFVNILIVVFFTKRLGILLVPARTAPPGILQSVVKSYRWLMLAALFAAASTPMNFMFAGSVGAGAVSAWALASKIVLLFNGLAGVGVSAIVLPHFARLFVQDGAAGLRNQVYFLLIFGSWVGGALALAVFEYAEPLVSVLFSGGAVTDDQIKDLSNVVKTGALQLPVVIVAAVIVKMAAVSGASSRAVIAAASGLLLNILFNFILVPRLGVMGIAVGALLASGISTVYLAIVTRKLCGFDMREVFVLVVGWIVWGGACVALGAQSGAAIVCATLGLAGLGWAQWKVSQSGLRHGVI